MTSSMSVFLGEDLHCAPVVAAALSRYIAAPMLDRWTRFAEVAGDEGAPLVTTEAPLRLWLATLRDGWPAVGLQRRAVLMCLRGMSVVDFAAYCAVTHRGRVHPQDALLTLLAPSGVPALTGLDPQIPVRDAVGWLLAYRAAAGAGEVLVERVRPWLDAGFTLADHALPAAGFAPDEAAALAGQGRLPDAPNLDLLAALRGTPTPSRW